MKHPSKEKSKNVVENLRSSIKSIIESLRSLNSKVHQHVIEAFGECTAKIQPCASKYCHFGKYDR
jgi:hypothetical protein